MDKEKFKLRLDIKTGDEEIDLYIKSLHDYVLSFDTSNIKKVILSLDNVMGDISDDLNLISTGDTWIPEVQTEDADGNKTTISGYSKLKVLSDESSSKTFDRVMTLIKVVKDLRAVSDEAEKLKPEIEQKKKETLKPTMKIDPTANAFEQIQKSINQKK